MGSAVIYYSLRYNLKHFSAYFYLSHYSAARPMIEIKNCVSFENYNILIAPLNVALRPGPAYPVAARRGELSGSGETASRFASRWRLTALRV